jgi:ABC-type transport system involved in multi-copper enzyme maturation permease subunit
MHYLPALIKKEWHYSWRFTIIGFLGSLLYGVYNGFIFSYDQFFANFIEGAFLVAMYVLMIVSMTKFSQINTFSHLLILPVSRLKIVLGKFLSLYLFTSVLLGMIMVISLFLSWFVNGEVSSLFLKLDYSLLTCIPLSFIGIGIPFYFLFGNKSQFASFTIVPFIFFVFLLYSINYNLNNLFSAPLITLEWLYVLVPLQPVSFWLSCFIFNRVEV